MRFKILTIICVLILGCNNNGKSVNDKSNFYKKVSIDKIIENPSKYNNKKVEIEGFFYFRMEDSSLSNKEKSTQEDRIWVEFDFFNDLKNEKMKFLFKDDNLMNYVGKKTKIRGVYSIKYKGHLAAYNGSIKVANFICKDENYGNSSD